MLPTTKVAPHAFLWVIRIVRLHMQHSVVLVFRVVWWRSLLSSVKTEVWRNEATGDWNPLFPFTLFFWVFRMSFMECSWQGFYVSNLPLLSCATRALLDRQSHGRATSERINSLDSRRPKPRLPTPGEHREEVRLGFVPPLLNQLLANNLLNATDIVFHS